MRKKHSFCFLIFSAVFLLLSVQLFSQGLDQTAEVKLKDGTILIGKITSQTSEEIILSSTTFGEMTISRTSIKSIQILDQNVGSSSGRFNFPNPNPSKYLIGQSGIPMEKGSVAYQNVWIFFNSFTYTPIDFFSITGGFEIFSLFLRDKGPYIFMLNPKVSFNVIDDLYLGGNIMYINLLNKDSINFSGIATLNAFASYGNSDYNGTAAVGWGWVQGNFSEKPVITLSGMARLTNGLGLVSENWLIPNFINEEGGFYGIYSYGLRFIGEKTSIDLAFINNREIASVLFIGIPFLDFVVKF